MNSHRALFAESGDVASIDVLRRPVPSLIVHWRNESLETDSPALRRIHDQYGRVETPLTTRPILGFERLTNPHGLLDLGNLNRDVLPQITQEQIIRQALESQQGRQRLAQAMVAPIRQRMDYQSVGRRTFLVEQLPEGALPIYDSGTDANGSEVPPFVRPDWLQIGQWVQHPEAEGGQVVACITELTMLRVQVAVWRTEKVLHENVVTFSTRWRPCEKPKDPRDAWTRLLADEDF